MKKRRPLKLMAAALGAWGMYSWWLMNRQPLDEEVALTYWRELLEPKGLDHVLDAMEMTELPVDDLSLKLYVLTSKPDDPTVVFVPGTSLYAVLYGEFMYKLNQQDFNVIGYDCRGHGLSTGKRGSYTIGELVDDTKEVTSYAIDRFNDRVAVAGSSQGGIVAFHSAAADARLGAVVCHNILAPDEPDVTRLTRYPELYSRMLELVPQLLPLFNYARPLGELRWPVEAYLDLKKESSFLLEDTYRFFHEDPLVVRYISFYAFMSLITPLARPVEEIETPVMVIHSELDNIFPEDYVRRVFDRLNCEKEFLYLPDTPHLVMTDYVDEIIPGVTSWLNDNLS